MSSKKLLNAFSYKTTENVYSYNNQFSVINAPDDTDWERWAMLNDGEDFRLYFFKEDSNTTLYQFAYNGTDYEFGYNNSIKEIPVKNVPENTNINVFAMLHDGTDYRLYLGNNTPNELYQFVWDGNTYVYKPEMTVTISNIPKTANLGSIAVLHDGTDYHLYLMDYNTPNELHQFVWDGSTYVCHPEWEMTITNIPNTASTTSFAMLYGENTYFLYLLNESNNNVFDDGDF